MSFQDAVRTTLTAKYATFSGRARRSEFWFFVLFQAIVLVVAQLLDRIIPGDFPIVYSIAGLALLVPFVAAAVRRLHDTGRSGWWFLINFTGIGAIVLLVFYILDSTPGANQHGPNPKESAAVGVA